MPNSACSRGELTVELPAAATERLLTVVPQAFNATVDDVLITGAARAIEQIGLTQEPDDSAHVVELSTRTRQRDGGPVLAATWTWDRVQLTDADAHALASAWLSALHELSGIWPGTPARAETPGDDRVVQVAIDLDGPVDQNRLRSACQQLLDGHEDLRSTFARPGVRVVVASAAMPWRTTYLAAYDELARQAEVARTLADERTRGFDPTRPPLLRAHLLRFRPQRHTLVLSAHHAVTDAESLPALSDEVFRLYAGDAVVRGIEVHADEAVSRGAKRARLPSR